MPNVVRRNVVQRNAVRQNVVLWNVIMIAALSSFASKQALADANSDFQARCAAAGVIRCYHFDTTADLGPANVWGANFGYFNNNVSCNSTSCPVVDISTYASGGGSMKFTIPVTGGAGSSGQWYGNFSPDLSVQFGADSDFYIQWRQRFSPEYLSQLYGGDGWKMIDISAGDNPGCTTSDNTNCNSSCTDIEIVTINSNYHGYPDMYNSCAGSSSHGAYDPFQEPFGSSDFKNQNAMPSPYCLYTQNYKLGAPQNPPGNCFIFYPNEWMTFQEHIHTGPVGSNFVAGASPNDEWVNSHVDLWVARQGQPSQQVISWGTPAFPYDLTGGTASGEKYGKVWLLPYDTNRSATVSAAAYTWFDELIISRNKIADPGSVSGTPVPCDLNGDGTVNALDLQSLANAILSGSSAPLYDLNKDSHVDAIDVQFLVNVVMNVRSCL
jgi:hypothetical protein